MNVRAIGMAAVVVIGSLFISVQAEDKAKEVTLKGKATCAKCELAETEKCQTVLIVMEGDKSVTYYLAATKAEKDFHKVICKKAKEGVSVTGTVSEKDGKKWIEASKIDSGA